MNKKRGIIIGVLALFVVMVVGYALFSENIEIKGTATAKGEFDMAVSCVTGLDPKFGSISEVGLEPEGGYKNDSCTVADNTVTLNVDFEYPFARRYFTIKMTNTGTIDATLNFNEGDGVTTSGKVCIDGGPDMQIDETNGEIEEADECHDINSEIGSFTSLYHFNPSAFEKADGTIVTDETELENFVDETGENVKLKPGQSLYILAIGQMWDYNDNAKDFLVTTDVSYVFNWKQIKN